MKLLRVVLEFDAKKDTDIGRQTVFIKEEELNKKHKLKIRGKTAVKSLTIELIDSTVKT